MSTLLAIAWQVENWRGRKRWEKTKAEILARGDSLDWRTFIPEAVPDEENAAMHPVFDVTIAAHGPKQSSGCFPFHRDFEPLVKSYFRNFPNRPPIHQPRLDLEYWHRILVDGDEGNLPKDVKTLANEVLAATDDVGTGIRAFSEAFSRPRCQWFPYHDQLFNEQADGQAVGGTPYFMEMAVQFTVATFVRSLANLETGNNSAAREAMIASLRFSRSMDENPLCVGALTSWGLGLEEVRYLPQLLRHPAWGEADLETLAGHLESPDFLDRIDKCLKLDRASTIHYGTSIVSGRPLLSDATIGVTGRRDWKFYASVRLMPHGWIYQSMAADADLWYEAHLHRYDSRLKRIVATDFPDIHSKLENRCIPYGFFARRVFPKLADPYYKAAIVQSQWDLCRVLCALERHRRVHGELPEKLEALVPEFLTGLPHDYVTGLPPHYRIGADGQAELATLDWDKTGNPETFLCRVPSSG
ncbi:MAG: hypothetical protein R3F19_15985 [Verrucomicrobiales bacterium]